MLRHEPAAAVNPARVVVLGARGFVAGALARWLCREQVPCRSVGRQEVDLADPAAPGKLKGILTPQDAIVMTAALTPEHGRDRTTFLKNVAMADHLCTAIAAVRCSHVLYISSDSVYDSRCGVVHEESCCETGDMYGLSHVVREKMLLQACAGAAVNLAIIRPGAIYGAADTHNSYGPNRFARSALHEGRIRLFGQGEELRDHIYIDDVLRIVHLCLLRRSCGVVNAVSGAALSFAQVAQGVVDAVDRPVALDSLPRHVAVTHRQFDAAALRSAFPEFAPTPFPAGIRQTLAELVGA